MNDNDGPKKKTKTKQTKTKQNKNNAETRKIKQLKTGKRETYLSLLKIGWTLSDSLEGPGSRNLKIRQNIGTA